jgi:hypothetical protein
MGRSTNLMLRRHSPEPVAELTVTYQILLAHGSAARRARVRVTRLAVLGAQPVQLEASDDGTLVVRYSVPDVVREMVVRARLMTEHTDRQGVHWEDDREVRYTISGRGPFRVQDVEAFGLHRSRHDISAFGLDQSAIDGISQHAEADLLLYDIAELFDALAAGLPSSSLVMSGKILDGTLKLKGDREHWWNSDWDDKPLGFLLDRPEVKAAVIGRLGRGYWDRLRASALARNPAAHQKFSQVSYHDALSVATIVLEAVNVWFSIP